VVSDGAKKRGRRLHGMEWQKPCDTLKIRMKNSHEVKGEDRNARGNLHALYSQKKSESHLKKGEQIAHRDLERKWFMACCSGKGTEDEDRGKKKFFCPSKEEERPNSEIRRESETHKALRRTEKIYVKGVSLKKEGKRFHIKKITSKSVKIGRPTYWGNIASLACFRKDKSK